MLGDRGAEARRLVVRGRVAEMVRLVVGHVEAALVLEYQVDETREHAAGGREGERRRRARQRVVRGEQRVQARAIERGQQELEAHFITLKEPFDDQLVDISCYRSQHCHNRHPAVLQAALCK